MGHSSLSKGQLGHLRASFKTSENFTTQIIGGYRLIPNENIPKPSFPSFHGSIPTQYLRGGEVER
jgi:hypothetical protein